MEIRFGLKIKDAMLNFKMKFRVEKNDVFVELNSHNAEELGLNLRIRNVGVQSNEIYLDLRLPESAGLVYLRYVIEEGLLSITKKDSGTYNYQVGSGDFPTRVENVEVDN